MGGVHTGCVTCCAPVVDAASSKPFERFLACFTLDELRVAFLHMQAAGEVPSGTHPGIHLNRGTVPGASMTQQANFQNSCWKPDDYRNQQIENASSMNPAFCPKTQQKSLFGNDDISPCVV